MNVSKYRSAVGLAFCTLAMTTVFDARSAGSSDVAPGGASAPLKGTVVYQGTYNGSSVQKNSRRPVTKDLEGASTIVVLFDGPAVDATFRNTGSMQGFRATGLREGDNCRLFIRDSYVVEGQCSAQGFDGLIKSTANNRLDSEVQFSANATKVNDIAKKAEQAEALRKKQEDDSAAEQQRQDNILKSLPSAPAKR